MKGLFQRLGTTIVPCSEDAWEALYAIPNEATFVVDIKGSRNPKQHALFFALCQILAENSDVYDTKEKAKRGLLIATGNVVTWMDHLGILHIDPRSIAFDAMEQAEFNAFFQLAVAKICDWLGNAPEEIRKRVAEMTDPVKGAKIPNKPEPYRLEPPTLNGEIMDPDTGEILSPEPAKTAPRKIVEPVIPPQGPIKWKALADGLCQCKTAEEFKDRAKRFWFWHNGWPPQDPTIRAKAEAIHAISAKFIKKEIDATTMHREMDQALQL